MPRGTETFSSGEIGNHGKERDSGRYTAVRCFVAFWMHFTHFHSNWPSKPSTEGHVARSESHPTPSCVPGSRFLQVKWDDCWGTSQLMHVNNLRGKAPFPLQKEEHGAGEGACTDRAPHCALGNTMSRPFIHSDTLRKWTFPTETEFTRSYLFGGHGRCLPRR